MKVRKLAVAVLIGLLVAGGCGDSDDARLYEVILDVAYHEELRVPGLGYVLHEFDLTYDLGAAAAPGTFVEPAATGSATWTVRCYEDQFASDQEPFAEFSGTHPAIFDWDRGDLRRSDLLEGGVDWTAGPGMLLLESDDKLQVVHRLPAAIAADREIGCDADDQYTAIALSLGDAAMTAPGRVNVDGVDMNRAEALNDAAGGVRYVLDDEGSGWLVFEISVADVTDDFTPFVYSYDPGPEPEGGARLEVDGTVRRAPAATP